MVKHTQAIHRQFAYKLFDHFVGLALKGLRLHNYAVRTVLVFEVLFTQD